MKICAIICEYNPFHNGHQYLIEEAKNNSNADAILCLMSGNFVQRGEAAIFNKFLRAKHAVLGGADIVLELPTVFATSNAEIFASGAISILSKIPEVTHLCFGAELPDKQSFLNAAIALKEEPQIVSDTVKRLTREGMGYAAALTAARKEFVDERLLTYPNNILGLEYAKAIVSQGANIEIIPISRRGSGHRDDSISGEYSSATALREAVNQGNEIATKSALPYFVYQCLPNATKINLEQFEKLTILQKSAAALAAILDCTEGLEHAFLKAATLTAPLEKTLCSPRYTAARIRRIALQNLLGIEESFIRECLSSPLYLNPLAFKRERQDLLSVLSKANIPFLCSGKSQRALSSVGMQCKRLDEYAETLYSLFSGNEIKQTTVIV